MTMPNVDQMRAQSLIALAKNGFDADLSDAELGILTDSAASSDPVYADSGAPKPEVRAGLIRWILTDPGAASYLDAKGLRARCVTVTGDLDLSNQAIDVPIVCWVCDFPGQIVLDFARTKTIYLTGATLEKGLTADGAIVAGLLSMVAAVSNGPVNLQRVMIQGDLDLSQTQLNNEKSGLIAFEGKVAGSIYLRQEFCCTASVELYNSWIGGILDCTGADIGNFLLYNATIQNEFFWYGIKDPARIYLDLSDAKVKRMRDDKASWPSPEQLMLDGFQYDELVLHQKPKPDELTKSSLPQEIAITADQRVAWLLRQKSDDVLKPQPWMQLRKALEARGDDDGARHVVFRLQRERALRQPRPARWWQIAFAWLQESPLRILYTIALVVLMGGAVFGWAASVGAMAPTEHEAYKEWAGKQPIGSAYPKLNPLVYSLENALPLVKLGQDDKWAPNPNFNSGNSPFIYALLVGSRWFLILSGWVQATVLAAALSDRFKS